MPTSAAPAVKAALVAAITAAAPASTQVIYGRPRPTDWLSPDVIAVLEVDATQDATVMGTRAREEKFTVTVLCSSWVGGDDQQAATVAAYAALAVVEGALRTDPGLTALCRSAQVVGHLLAEDFTEAGDRDPAGRVAEIAAAINVVARI